MAPSNEHHKDDQQDEAVVCLVSPVDAVQDGQADLSSIRLRSSTASEGPGVLQHNRFSN